MKLFESSFLKFLPNRMNAVERLQKASVESFRCLYPILSDLKCVSQIEQAVSTVTK